MSNLKHLIMTDETGKAILAAIQNMQSDKTANSLLENISTFSVAGVELSPDDDGKLDVPYASDSAAGVVKFLESQGIEIDSNGNLYIVAPTNDEIFARKSPYKPITLSKLDYAMKVAMCDTSVVWNDGEKSAARSRLGLDDYVLPLKVNKDGKMTVEEAYQLSDGLYYFIKPLYNASSDGHSIHGMCSVSEHFINNYDYGIYFGDYSSSSQKFTTVGSIDGYGQIEQG